jgi:hypothetical protein
MNLREMQQQLENNISQSLDSLETMHRMAANSAFEQLGQIAPVAEIIQSVRPLYETGVSQVIEFGRTANRTGGDVARAVLDRIGM